MKRLLSIVLLAITCINYSRSVPGLANLVGDVKEFYYMRHGQTNHNIGLVKGTVNLPLNKKGRQQAMMVESLIAALPIRTICYSPLLRTTETKEIVNAQLQLPEYVIDNLRESRGGLWSTVRILNTTGFHAASPALQDFVVQVRNGICSALLYPGPVLIIGHATFYYVLCYLLQVTENNWMIENCEPVRFYRNEEDKWKVERLINYKKFKRFIKTTQDF